MFLFPIVFLGSFIYALIQLFKKQIEGFLIFIIIGLPIYINSMSVSFLYGFGKWIPTLQSLKEIAVVGAVIMVVTQLSKKPIFHLIDKLI